MPTGITIWLVYAAVAGVVWLIRLIAMTNGIRRQKTLRADASHHQGDILEANPPRLSVLVAAKDEEENIEACVRSLVNQDYPDFEVIAINDRSTDRTQEILETVAAESNGKLNALSVTELKPGWFGKNNAMRTGLEHATGEYFLFTDADCRFESPRALTIAMYTMRQRNIDFISLFPKLESVRPWERILQPVAALVLMIWFLPWRVNSSVKKVAYANGAFMMMTRDAYHHIGGHERVKTQVNEDIHMARFAKESGLKLRVFEQIDLYVTRMYRTLSEAYRGWSRIYYGSLTRGQMSLTLLFILSFTAIPWISLLVSLGWLAVATGDFRSTMMTVAGAWLAVVVLMHIVTARYFITTRVHPGWSLAYPIGVSMTVAMLINAIIKASGGTMTWRGTTYSGDQVVSQGQASSAGSAVSGATHATIPAVAPAAAQETSASVSSNTDEEKSAHVR